MPARPHILVVNGRKVRQPVFVIGASHSGTDLLARALKQLAGFHLTIGQRAVVGVVHAFARSPSIQRGRGDAATTVLRDAFAQAWQVSPYGCMACSAPCRAAGGVDGAGVCVAEPDITRYGDGGPDLIYCADGLAAAFPDARIVQIVRVGDGAEAAASPGGGTGRGRAAGAADAGRRRGLVAPLQGSEVAQVAGAELRRGGCGGCPGGGSPGRGSPRG